MIALMKELSMTQEHPRRRRFPIGARRPFDCEAASLTERCYLQIGRAQVPVDVPADVLRKHRRDGEAILLRVPSEHTIPVEETPLLSSREERLAREWWTEMEDFDRF